MLRLVYSAEPAWLDLLGDIRVQVLPFRSSLMAAAKAGIDTRVGLDAPGEVRFSALAYELAKLAIIAWEGVADQDDQPVPVTPDAVEALMDFYVLHEAFTAKYVTPGILMGAEKKGSAPSPNGFSVMARTTAPAAKPAAPTARKH